MPDPEDEPDPEELEDEPELEEPEEEPELEDEPEPDEELEDEPDEELDDEPDPEDELEEPDDEAAPEDEPDEAPAPDEEPEEPDDEAAPEEELEEELEDEPAPDEELEDVPVPDDEPEELPAPEDEPAPEELLLEELPDPAGAGLPLPPPHAESSVISPAARIGENFGLRIIGFEPGYFKGVWIGQAYCLATACTARLEPLSYSRVNSAAVLPEAGVKLARPVMTCVLPEQVSVPLNS